MTEPASVSFIRVPLAGFLAWVAPGLGHLFLGHRGRGWVFLVTITATFWTGVAIGGVRGTIDPDERKLWFVAQLCTGGNTVIGYLWERVVSRNDPREKATVLKGPWASAELGVHYTGVAGLLNLLVILDALGRAESRSPDGKARRQQTDSSG